MATTKTMLRLAQMAERKLESVWMPPGGTMVIET